MRLPRPPASTRPVMSLREVVIDQEIRKRYRSIVFGDAPASRHASQFVALVNGSPWMLRLAWPQAKTQASSMSSPAAVPVATVDELRGRLRRKSKLKGRQPDHDAVAEVRALV